MKDNTKQAPTAKRKTYARELGAGRGLEAEVSPCVFTCPGYPLQVQVTLHKRPGEWLGMAYLVDRGKTAATYSDADVERLLAGVRTTHCPRCSGPAFDPATVETNRGGLCEACFLECLEAEMAAAELADRQETAARDRREKEAGMAFRARGWVHPRCGGDDYQVDWYFQARPSPEQVAALLEGQGSAVLDDYEIVAL